MDKLQTTANGSRTFAATDVLAEHQGLRSEHDSAGHPVILIKSTDYSKKQLVQGHFLWVTFAVGEFADADAVRAWCDTEFAGLAEAERLNQCAIRKLAPPR